MIVHRFLLKNKRHRKRCLLSGGGRWIRTTEGIASRFTVCPLWPLGNSPMFSSRSTLKSKPGESVLTCGAGGRTRTPDLLITNQLLYRLSYTSILPASPVYRPSNLTPERLVIIANQTGFVNHYFSKIEKYVDRMDTQNRKDRSVTEAAAG